MVHIKNHVFLAIKNLKKRKTRAWLTLLGIFIGIAAVVALISLGAGLQNAVTGQFASLGTDKLIITNAETSFGPPGSTSIKKLTDHDLEIIQGVNGVDIAVARLLRLTKVEYNKIVNYGFIISMPQDDDKISLVYDTLNVKPESGKILSKDSKGKVLLGHDYSKDSIYGKPIVVGSKININGEDFEVMGILSAASTFQINSVIFMLDDDVESLLNINNEWDMINVRISTGYDIEKVAGDIKEKIRRDRKEKLGEEDFSVQTPTQAFDSVKTILNIINLIVVGIAAISLLVGGVGIANTMYTSVLERTKEIGVMKAIGAKNSDILLIFLFESGLLGLIGGVIGAAIGLSLALGLSAGANAVLETQLLAVQVSWLLLFSAVGFSLLIGILAGVLPAIQASKLKPVDALRS